MVGKVVKYSKPESEKEGVLRFVVVEDNGDRILIRLICDWTIPPVELVRPNDVVEVRE